MNEMFYVEWFDGCHHAGDASRQTLVNLLLNPSVKIKYLSDAESMKRRHAAICNMTSK